MLEALSLEFLLTGDEAEDFIGSTIQTVEKILVKPGWSTLRQVSFTLLIPYDESSTELFMLLQFLPDRYLSHLPKIESIAFNYSVQAY